MLSRQDVESWIRREPFEPFVLMLSSGDRVPVLNRETIFVGRRRIHVVRLRGGEYDDFVDVSLLHVVKIERLDGAKGRRPRRASRRT
jgi:hypothetical protein